MYSKTLFYKIATGDATRGAAGRICTRSNLVENPNFILRIINVENFCNNSTKWTKLKISWPETDGLLFDSNGNGSKADHHIKHYTFKRTPKLAIMSSCSATNSRSRELLETREDAVATVQRILAGNESRFEMVSFQQYNTVAKLRSQHCNGYFVVCHINALRSAG